MKTLLAAPIRFLRTHRSSFIVIYAIAAVIYFLIFGKAFIKNLEAPTWLIAPIMAFGSFVAGATFLGGGSVAFPALTKLLAIEPNYAKTFSLAIQSVGMTSASLYIISRVPKLPLIFISLYLSASTVGMYLALAFFEHLIAPIDLRVSFSLFLLCFLVVYLATRNARNDSTSSHLEKNARDFTLTLACGVLGGIVSGLLGSGADLIGFSLLALYFRIEIKRATQISVILMAATALIGTAMQGWVFQRLSHEVMNLWYVAAPIVLFGAPIGAVFCRRISSKFLLIFICFIVLIEVASTFILVPIDLNRALFYSIASILSVGLLILFIRLAHLKHRND